MLLGAIGFLVLLYIAAFTHGRRIIAHFLPMAIDNKKQRLYAFLVRDRACKKGVRERCSCGLWYDLKKGDMTMRTKIQNVVVGCWYVFISELHILLVRVRILSPDPDPRPLPFEE